MSYFRQDLKENEQLIAIVRKHPLLLIIVCGPQLLLLGVSWYFAIAFSFVFASSIRTALFLLWNVLLLLIIFEKSYVWYLDSFILTSQRIIEVDQRGVLERIVQEAPLGDITNVSYEMKGFLQTSFGYGDVTIHTTGAPGILRMEDVAKPQRLRALLFETRAKQQA
jgi:hypothetical protein